MKTFTSLAFATFIFLGFSSSSWGAKTSLPQGPKNILVFEKIKVCKDQTIDFIRNLPISNDWVLQAPSRTGSPARAASKTFGTWYETDTNAEGKMTLSEISKSRIIKTTWGADCKIKTETVDGFNFAKSQHELGADYFDDRNLMTAISGDEEGLIYLWSPGMVYSANYFSQYRDAAAALKLKFIPLVDPRASAKSIAKAEKKFGVPPGIPRMNSVELYMRGMTVHYPSAILFRNKKLVDPIIVGVFPKEELQTEIKKVLKGNKE